MHPPMPWTWHDSMGSRLPPLRRGKCILPVKGGVTAAVQTIWVLAFGCVGNVRALAPRVRTELLWPVGCKQKLLYVCPFQREALRACVATQ